jgi:DNA uptake protein ComE-like DNA-binding protein
LVFSASFIHIDIHRYLNELCSMEASMKASALSAIAALVAIAACSSDSARTADSAAAADTPAMSAAPGDTMAAPAPAASAGGMMDPNAASEADLATIPGVTPQVASAIVAARPFTNNLGLEKVLATTSLTEQQKDSVYSRLWTKIDLNTATDDEILLIPGVGSRMLREFKEYRPYTSMDQWRREIGKYVDDAELARLERYVALR